MSAWNRIRQRKGAHHEQLARSAECLRPLERLALLCDLATSSDAEARRLARALLRRFPNLPGADWVAEHLDASAPALRPDRAVAKGEA